MRQRHRGCQRDDVAAEQRQLHAGAALRDAVAHRGHATGHLRGGAGQARRGADHFGIGLERLVRRQHVVVRGDDADVRDDRLLQLRLVFARRRHDVREVGAGQLAARRLDELSLARAFEIVAARRGGAAADAFSDFDDDVVELLGGHAYSYQLWPCRSVRAIAAVGPQVPAGYGFTSWRVERQLVWMPSIQFHAASTSSRRTNSVVFPLSASSSRRS